MPGTAAIKFGCADLARIIAIALRALAWPAMVPPVPSTSTRASAVPAGDC